MHAASAQAPSRVDLDAPPQPPARIRLDHTRRAAARRPRQLTTPFQARPLAVNTPSPVWMQPPTGCATPPRNVRTAATSAVSCSAASLLISRNAPAPVLPPHSCPHTRVVSQPAHLWRSAAFGRHTRTPHTHMPCGPPHAQRSSARTVGSSHGRSTPQPTHTCAHSSKAPRPHGGGGEVRARGVTPCTIQRYLHTSQRTSTTDARAQPTRCLCGAVPPALDTLRARAAAAPLAHPAGVYVPPILERPPSFRTSRPASPPRHHPDRS
jgi:hypothetical protein